MTAAASRFVTPVATAPFSTLNAEAGSLALPTKLMMKFAPLGAILVIYRGEPVIVRVAALEVSEPLAPVSTQV